MGKWNLRVCLAGTVALATMACASDAPKHWNAFEQCLIGGPLAKDENVFLKLRGVQLAESLESSGGENAWPNRCAVHATALHESLGDDGKPGMIKRALSEQLVCDGPCKFPAEGHPLPAADKLWEAVERAELKRQAADGVKKPKAPITSLTTSDWPVFSSGTLEARQWAASGALWLLLKTEKGRRWCSLKGDKAKCKDIEGAPKFHASAPMNLAPTGQQPILAGSLFSDGSGLYRAGFALDTSKEVPLYGEPGQEVFDGVGFVERTPEEQAQPSPDAPSASARTFDVQRLEKGKVRARGTVDVTARVRGPVVAQGWLVYVERDEEQKTVFKAKKLGKDARLFDADQVEHTTEVPGGFSLCSSDPGVAIGAYTDPVRQLGKKVSGKSPLVVLLLQGNTWHTPVKTEIPRQVGQFSGWRCGAGWGGFTWIEQLEDKLTVSELRCTKDGCKTTDVSWTQPDLKNVLALDYVQDDVLLLYQSVAGDTRHRLAALDKLPSAKSQLTFENADFGGLELGKPELAVADQTYLFVKEGGLRALQFDGTRVLPVKP